MEIYKSCTTKYVFEKTCKANYFVTRNETRRCLGCFTLVQQQALTEVVGKYRKHLMT